ncbi:MAG: hypothetical protein R3C18_04315 [Planctomycetaceae bacterium]
MYLRLIHLVIAVYAFWEAWDGARRLRHGLLKSLLFGGLGLIHGIVPCVGPAWYDRTVDPFSIHVAAGLYALCGIVLIGCGWHFYMIIASKKPYVQTFELLKHDQLQPRLNALFVVCAVVGVIAWLGWIHASGVTLANVLSARRMELREQRAGLLGAVWGNLFYISYFPGFLSPFLRGRYRVAGTIYPIVFALALFIFSRGTRGPAIGMLGSLIGGWVFAHRISLGRLMMATAAFGMIGMLTVAMLPLRHRMHSMTTGEMVTFVFSAEAYQDALTLDPLNYHDHFVGICALFPDFEPYVDGASYRRLAFFYLPGEYFPGLKPRDPNRVVAVALFGQKAIENNMMHPPGVFGDWYINFWGWRGLPFMFLEGVFLAWLSRQIVSNPWFLIGLGPQVIYLSVIGIRGQPYTVGLAGLLMLSLSFCLLKVLGLPVSPIRPKQLVPVTPQQQTSSLPAQVASAA